MYIITEIMNGGIILQECKLTDTEAKSLIRQRADHYGQDYHSVYHKARVGGYHFNRDDDQIAIYKTKHTIQL